MSSKYHVIAHYHELLDRLFRCQLCHSSIFRSQINFRFPLVYQASTVKQR